PDYLHNIKRTNPTTFPTHYTQTERLQTLPWIKHFWRMIMRWFLFDWKSPLPKRGI
ncbi:unnamed protein product, partial [Ectocarpus fasciculatus]